MKRPALFGALLVAVLACTLALSTPRPAQTFPCCVDCCSTSQYWEMAATCADAQAAFRAAAFPEAEANCGGLDVCGIQVPNCYASGNMWVADGYMYHGCIEQCGPPPI